MGVRIRERAEGLYTIIYWVKDGKKHEKALGYGVTREQAELELSKVRQQLPQQSPREETIAKQLCKTCLGTLDKFAVHQKMRMPVQLLNHSSVYFRMIVSEIAY